MPALPPPPPPRPPALRRHAPLAAAALRQCLAAARTAAAADDPQAPLKAQLQRIGTVQARRPGDGLLVSYRAMALAALQRRDDVREAWVP